MRIDGSRIVITGASSGIGLAVSRLLAQRGAALVVASRHRPQLEAAVRSIALTASGPLPIPVGCDVADQGNVRELIEIAMDHLGRIDVLINNAGICVYGEMESTAMSDVRELFAVNFLGPLHAMLDIVPHMKQNRDGLVVNILSAAALHGIPYLGAYGASKAALAAVSQSLRAELAEWGIRITNVYPGYTATPLFEHEKKVGGARRPTGSYEPVTSVARSVIRAIETETPEVVLSRDARRLAVLRGITPRLVNRAMKRLAAGLREPTQVRHV